MPDYESLFLANNGTNIFTTLGFLKKIQKCLERTKYWNVTGCSSLIIFLRVVGNNYDQILNILGSFSLMSTFINGSSLIPEDELSKKNYIKNWLTDHLKDSEFFSKDIKLEEVFKKTNLFPNFILWSRSQKKIVCMNPENNPRAKLIDCVMASLCYIGVYEEYEFLGETYTNLCGINCFPYEHVYDRENSSQLFIGNTGKYEDRTVSILGPLCKKEGMIINQYTEHERYTIEKIFTDLEDKEKVRIYSFYRRGNLGSEETKTLFELGIEQGSAFLGKQDTELCKEKYMQKVESQP